MNWGIVLLASSLVGQVANPPTQVTEDLALDISVQVYRRDARTSTAGNHGSLLEGYVWTDETFCQVGSSGREPSVAPAFGWKFSGSIVKRTGDEFTVRVDWQRLWDRAERSDARGSMTSVMHKGDRLPLDTVLPPSAGLCRATMARLEAAIVPSNRSSASRDRLLEVLALTGAARARLASGSGRGASGAGTGGGGGGGAGAGAGGTATSGTRAGGGGANARPLGMDAELWLVHTLPGGTDEVQQQKVPLSYAGSTFVFPPVPVATARGTVAVEVTALLQVNAATEPASLLVSLRRAVSADSSLRADTAGGSGKQIPIPTPGEVISFELPPFQGLAEELLRGHKFSVRLRVTNR